jgi:hypothetical protein
MSNLKITRCTGNGQGSCTGCEKEKGWNRVWMSMLFKIDGFDGLFCADCVRKIKDKVNSDESD